MLAGGQSLVLDVENVGALLLAGKIFSALAVAGIIAVIVNCWRRDAFPGVSYGDIELSHGRLRWLWILFILGGGARGSVEDPVVQAGTTISMHTLQAPGEYSASAVRQLTRWASPVFGRIVVPGIDKP